MDPVSRKTGKRSESQAHARPHSHPELPNVSQKLGHLAREILVGQEDREAFYRQNRRHASGGHGRVPSDARSLTLARLRLGQGPRRSRGPVPAFGRQSGPREERRRPARLPAAPENLPQGSAPRNGADSARAHCGSGRFSAASVGGLHLMPPLQGARAIALAYARRTNPPRTAVLRWRLSVRAFQGHFSFKIARSGPEMAPAR